MKKLLQDRKTLYLVLGIVMISVFTLSIAYAAMSTVLEIHGNSEVVASTWDIHLDNVEVKSGSVSANAPQISGTSSLSFDVELNTPGDFYEFTVDVVNEGSIDAMIDSVVKTPELTTEQAKYIKYEITYANGESISTKQTLKKGTSTPIKVRVEYRKDLVAGDLPSTATELSLKLTLVYVQSDGSGTEIVKDGKVYAKVISGDGTQVGDEICIDTECFYVISSTDSTVTMLSKYNLHVGNRVDTGWAVSKLINPTGIQNDKAIGWFSGYSSLNPAIGTIPFSTTMYWNNVSGDFPIYIYNSDSLLYEYVENYKNYLTSFNIIPVEARLITYEELINLGCDVSSDNCADAPSWVYGTSYWSGSVGSSLYIWHVASNSYFGYRDNYNVPHGAGCRPVITISRDYF